MIVIDWVLEVCTILPDEFAKYGPYKELCFLESQRILKHVNSGRCGRGVTPSPQCLENVIAVGKSITPLGIGLLDGCTFLG